MSRGLKGAPGFMPPELRIAWRDRYGDFPALIDAARGEHEAGRLENAWVSYQVALNCWLRYKATGQWPQLIGDKMKSYMWAKRLACKRLLDDWACAIIKEMARRPSRVRPYHVDALAGLVEALTLERGRDG